MDGYTALGGLGEWFVGSLKWYGWREPFAGFGPLPASWHSAEIVFKICPLHRYCAGLYSAFQLLVRIRSSAFRALSIERYYSVQGRCQTPSLQS